MEKLDKWKLLPKGTKSGNISKRNGFIQQENGRDDVFVHFRQVNNDNGGRVTLAEGQKSPQV